MQIVWFNQPFIARQLSQGTEIAVSGMVGAFRGRPSFNNPDYERLAPADGGDGQHTGRLVPVYHLTEGLPQRTLRSTIATLVERYVDRLEDPLPASIRERHELPDLAESMRQIHYPDCTGARRPWRGGGSPSMSCWRSSWAWWAASAPGRRRATPR